MKIVPWDPFLMKKLLTSGICGFVTCVHCGKVNKCGLKKKKKERRKPQNKNANATII